MKITLVYSEDWPASPFFRDIERIALADRESLGLCFGQPCDPRDLISLYDVEDIVETYEQYESNASISLMSDLRTIDRWSGLLVELPSGNCLMLVNPNHPIARRNLTIAHEFGHPALGHRQLMLDPGSNLERTRYGDDQELEAFDYGLAVLLPYAPLLQILRQGAAASSIASHFRVSEEALEMRLKRVGLWGLRH